MGFDSLELGVGMQRWGSTCEVKSSEEGREGKGRGEEEKRGGKGKGEGMEEGRERKRGGK